MALTPEDGSIVAGADTFATVTELRAFAGKRGATLPSDDGACEVLLVKACDYIQAQSQRFKGQRVRWNQPLCWPRAAVCIDGFTLPFNQIPAEIKAAQMQLAIEVQTVDIMPTVDPSTATGPVIEKTVDVITKKFAEPEFKRTSPLLARVDGLLSKFYGAGASQVRLVRA